MSTNEINIDNMGFEECINLAYCHSTGISKEKSADKMAGIFKELIGEGTTGSKGIEIDEFYKNDGVIETILGDYYKTTNDLKSAEEKYKKAADKGNLRAMYNLAEIYLAKKDLKNAFDEYLKAAKNGFALAQMRVAEMFFKGKGVDRNFRKAFIWWSRAAKQKNLIRLENDSTCHVQGIGVIEKPKKAFKLWKKLYEESESDQMKINPEIAVNLGYCYEKGTGTKVDEKEAFKCYEKAANVENADGLYRLGYCYEKGIGTEENKNKAFVYYKKAAELGSGTAYFRIGMNCYREHEIEKAVENLSKAIAHGCFKACNVLAAILYDYSDKIDQAINLLQCAAQQGDHEAQYNLGYMYIQKVKSFLDGKIVIDKFGDDEKKKTELQNYQKLVAYTMNKASANGVVAAKNFLDAVAKIKNANDWITEAIKYFDNSNGNKQ